MFEIIREQTIKFPVIPASRMKGVTTSKAITAFDDISSVLVLSAETVTRESLDNYIDLGKVVFS